MTDLIRRSVLIDEICRSSIYKWSVEEDQAAHNWALNIINSQPSVESSKGDYISRADAIDVLQQFAEDEKPNDEMSKQFQQYQRGRHLAFLQAVEEIKALPSADAVHGEWVCKKREYNDCDGHYAHFWYECSVCGARPPKDTWKNEWHSNYCPSCGARMKGGDDE